MMENIETSELFNKLVWSNTLAQELRRNNSLLITFNFINFRSRLDKNLLGLGLILKLYNKKSKSSTVTAKYQVILVTGRDTRKGSELSDVELKYSLDPRKSNGCISFEYPDLPIAIISYMNLLQNSEGLDQEDYMKKILELFNDRAQRRKFVKSITNDFNSITTAVRYYEH